ncbi:hypothetical protein LJK87_07055 [Paenibacillus sp. P25]|nr:hypothetical protein LJK87_07055 [Paenibacillus sp. P25]
MGGKKQEQHLPNPYHEASPGSAIRSAPADIAAAFSHPVVSVRPRVHACQCPVTPSRTCPHSGHP